MPFHTLIRAFALVTMLIDRDRAIWPVTAAYIKLPSSFLASTGERLLFTLNESCETCIPVIFLGTSAETSSEAEYKSCTPLTFLGTPAVTASVASGNGQCASCVPVIFLAAIDSSDDDGDDDVDDFVGTAADTVPAASGNDLVERRNSCLLGRNCCAG